MALEHKGGWTNREILHWFGEYIDRVSRKLGARVYHWMVLNEPLVFTGAVISWEYTHLVGEGIKLPSAGSPCYTLPGSGWEHCA